MTTLYPTLEDMVMDQYQSVQRQKDDAHYWSSETPPMNLSYCLENSETPKIPSAPLYEPETVTHLPPHYDSISFSQSNTPGSVYPQAPPYFTCTVPENPSITTASAETKLPAKQPINEKIVVGNTVMVAPLTAQSSGVQKANVTHGVRQVKLPKNKKKDKYGLRFRSINKGIFVQFVAKGSAAAVAGIRFGDQILKVNDTEVLGKDGDKVLEMMTKPKDAEEVTLTIRDRPFERTMTLHKDSSGTFGFGHKENLIVSIVKDSSASRNGLLTDHRILEVDGRNIIGFSPSYLSQCDTRFAIVSSDNCRLFDVRCVSVSLLQTKEVRNCLKEASQTATFTLMPADKYDELVKKLGSSLMRKQDHSAPSET